jgi:hypothetical protein
LPDVFQCGFSFPEYFSHSYSYPFSTFRQHSGLNSHFLIDMELCTKTLQEHIFKNSGFTVANSMEEAVSPFIKRSSSQDILTIRRPTRNSSPRQYICTGSRYTIFKLHFVRVRRPPPSLHRQEYERFRREFESCKMAYRRTRR